MSTNNVSNVAMSVKANRFNRTSTSRKGRRESNNLPAPNPAHVSPRMRVTSSDSKTDSSVDRQEAEGALSNMVAKSMGVEVLLGRKGSELARPEVVRMETHNAKLIKIDCGGEMFITTETSLSRYPNTLLGDPARRARYFDESRGVYYFDRNQELFSAILYFYQSPGTFRPPEYFDQMVIDEECKFFDMDLPKMIDDYDKHQLSLNEPLPPTFKETIHQTITDPSYNKAAMVWAGVDLVCILLTISMMVTETIEAYKKHFENPFESPTKIAIYSLDVCINMFFTLDLVLKFSTDNEKKQFFFKTMNIMDVLAVSPFYVELMMFVITQGFPPPQFLALKVLRVCRIVRVVRVLKIVRHSKQLTEVMEVVGSAKEEFGVLIGVVGVVILLVGTVMYFVEYQLSEKRNEGFGSILHGCWWAIVTITTVGYGDIYPKSTLGKVTGSFVVLFGIVVLAFPMTIIISKFQDSFTMKKLAEDKEMTRKLRDMAIRGVYSVCGNGAGNSGSCGPATLAPVNNGEIITLT